MSGKGLKSSRLQDGPQAPYPMPFTRVELVVLSIVEGRLAILLGLRASAPARGQWALPGGVLRIDLDADLEAAAQRVARERLAVTLPFLRQLQTIGGPARDPRAPWALSVVYRALIPGDAIAPVAGKRLEALSWVAVDALDRHGTIAFDHRSLIDAAVHTTRSDIAQLQLPFEYLPPRFTLGELQACCEAFLGHALDKSSFRRKLKDRQLLEELEGEMRTGPFRPAQLYRRARPDAPGSPGAVTPARAANTSSGW